MKTKTYRLNLFEQLNGFYQWLHNNQQNNIKQAHISLYIYLLYLNNKWGWIEWFTVPYETVMIGSANKRRETYYKILHDLVDWGLIKYKPGINGQYAPLVSIIQMSENGLLPVPVPVLLPVPLPVPLADTIYITYNSRLITLNSGELFFDSNQSVRLQLIQILQNLKDEDIQISTGNEETAPPPDSGRPPSPDVTCIDFLTENYKTFKTEWTRHSLLGEPMTAERKDTFTAMLCFNFFYTHQKRINNFENDLFRDWRPAYIDLRKQFNSNGAEIINVIYFYLTEDTYAKDKVFTLRKFINYFASLRAEMYKRIEKGTYSHPDLTYLYDEDIKVREHQDA